MSTDFDLGSLEASNSGLDAFFGENPEVITPLAPEIKTAALPNRTNPDRGGLGKSKSKTAGRTKVASLEQLNGFIRTAEDQLVHKSDRDLWSLRKDAQGDFYVERMFDETGAPLKG